MLWRVVIGTQCSSYLVQVEWKEHWGFGVESTRYTLIRRILRGKEGAPP